MGASSSQLVRLYGLILDNEKRGVNKSLLRYINEREREIERLTLFAVVTIFSYPILKYFI